MLAMQMAKNPGSIIGGGGVDNSPAGTFVSKRQKLGDLEIELRSSSITTLVQTATTVQRATGISEVPLACPHLLGCLTDMPVIGGATHYREGS